MLPFRLIVPPTIRFARLLFHREALSRDHGFIKNGQSLRDDAVHRDPFSRTDEKNIAGENIRDGDVGLGAVPENPGGLWLQAEQLS